MYGWLTFDPEKGLLTPSFPTLQLPAKPCSNEELKLRYGSVAQFLEKECPKSTKEQQERRDRIAYDLKLIAPQVASEVLEFAMYLCRAHHMLDESQRTKRYEAASVVLGGIFADINPFSDNQAYTMRVLNVKGILMPDAYQKPLLEALAAKYRYDSLDESKVNPKYTHIWTALEPLIQSTAGHDPDLAGALRFTLRSRQANDRAPFAEQLVHVLSDGNNRMNLVHAHEQLNSGLYLAYAEVWDALASIIEELLTGEDEPKDIIGRQVAYAVAAHESRNVHALRVFFAALDAGEKMGATGELSRTALMSYRKAGASLRETMTVQARDAKALPKPKTKATPQKPKLLEGEKEDIDPVSSWSVERLARWIEGPVIEKGPKRPDVCRAILTKEKGEREKLKTADKTPNKTPNKTPIAVVDEKEIAGVIRDALSATACFFLDEIGDMLPLARELKAAEKLTDACEKMTSGLQALVPLPDKFDEDMVRAQLMAAEAAIQALRQGLERATYDDALKRRFPGQLSMALRNEKMVLGRRNGGRIYCPVGREDWSYVADTFHLCWAPQIKSIQVGNQTMQLDRDQAVALYVTGSSLSGSALYAFDVSVHLWRRRAGRTSAPSNESGPFPRMNRTDWFDTYVPCCVLHVPLAAPPKK